MDCRRSGSRDKKTHRREAEDLEQPCWPAPKGTAENVAAFDKGVATNSRLEGNDYEDFYPALGPEHLGGFETLGSRPLSGNQTLPLSQTPRLINYLDGRSGSFKDFALRSESPGSCAAANDSQ